MDIEEYFIDLISSDTAPIVFTYLSHNDIYNLSFLNKSLVKIIKKKLKEYIVYKINEKLRNILGKNFEIFKYEPGNNSHPLIHTAGDLELFLQKRCNIQF